MYAAIDNVEKNRSKSDKMYRCIIDCKSSDLDQVCSNVISHLEKEFVGQMSPRLHRTLLEVINTNDRIAKHGLLFFALNEANELQNIFLCDQFQHVPPQKFLFFVNSELPKLVDKLLNGSFTSLRSFTEDCRWTYATL
jgi:hypothetical protein